MAKTQCQVCGKNLLTTSKNYVYKNGIHQHLKCPTKKVLNEEDAKALRNLTDAIDWYTKKIKNPISPSQWRVVSSQIKQLVEQGYDYETQLKAFKHYFNPLHNTEYKGYGIMGYVIEKCLLEIEELEKVPDESQEEIKKNMANAMELKRLERLNKMK